MLQRRFARSAMTRGLTAGVALMLAAAVAGAQADRFAAAWPNTDFSRVTIDLSEVISGGPPRDGIPAIMAPDFLAAAAAPPRRGSMTVNR